jgi:hypothetical protein
MNQDVTNQLSQLFNQNYQQGTQEQLQSLQPLIAQGNAPEQMALQIAQMFGGMGSGTSSGQSTPSLLGMII